MSHILYWSAPRCGRVSAVCCVAGGGLMILISSGGGQDVGQLSGQAVQQRSCHPPPPGSASLLQAGVKHNHTITKTYQTPNMTVQKSPNISAWSDRVHFPVCLYSDFFLFRTNIYNSTIQMLHKSCDTGSSRLWLSKPYDDCLDYLAAWMTTVPCCSVVGLK